MTTKPRGEIMLVKVAAVGNQGKKWHIMRNDMLTYCKAKISWAPDISLSLSEINHLCLNCKREWEKEVEL